MNRRDFLASSVGGMVLAAAAGNESLAGQPPQPQPQTGPAAEEPISPRLVKLNVKPVMTSLIHTGVWEGPCRWRAVSVADEKAYAEGSFTRWSQQLKQNGLGPAEHVHLLEPARITFSEDFVLPPGELDKLAADSRSTDAYFVYPSGSSVAAFQIGKQFDKPILLQGLGCRNVDIAAYTRSRGQEAHVAADDAELAEILSLLRARKVFRGTRVLFPTDRGLPAACSVGSIWDLEGLEERLGVGVKQISYRELAEAMDKTLADPIATERAAAAADELLAKAEKSYIEKKYVVKSLQFYQAVRNLMARHGSNAFTIECFEFCSSRLPEKWTITPCLIHALLKNQGYAGSCEGDLGSLLAMRMLSLVSGKSCHQGNSDPRSPETFRINHSASSMKMNGYDQPDLPFQLGRFVSSGWGTKVVIDFMNQAEKTVTVARVHPAATKLLVLKGELVGGSGWGQDLIGCSVEAVIKPPQGRTEEFLKKRLDYGNHLQWVYGDYTRELKQLGEMLRLEVEVIG